MFVVVSTEAKVPIRPFGSVHPCGRYPSQLYADLSFFAVVRPNVTNIFVTAFPVRQLATLRTINGNATAAALKLFRSWPLVSAAVTNPKLDLLLYIFFQVVQAFARNPFGRMQ